MMPPQRPPQRPSIRQNLDKQAEDLLRYGNANPGAPRFDKFRERHIWSTGFLHTLAGGGIAATGIVAPTSELILFSAGLNTNGQGLPAGLSLTEADTNFVGAGRVPDDQSLSVREIGVCLGPMRSDLVALDAANMRNGPVLAEDLDAYLTNGVLALRYISSEKTLGPLGVFTQPGGPSMVAPTLLASTGEAQVSGALWTGGLDLDAGTSAIVIAQTSQNAGAIAAQPSLRRRLDIPINLGPGVDFRFVVKFPRPFRTKREIEGGTLCAAIRVDLYCVESFRSRG